MDQKLKLRPSSQIHSGSYDPATGRLTLELNGGHFAYHNVPEDVVIGLQKAKSHGDFFHEYIRGRKGEKKPFEYSRVK